MMDENDIIKQKLIERSADLDVARQRWIFAFITAVILFSVVLVIFILPLSETTSENSDRVDVSWNSWVVSDRISVIAIPSTYWIHLDFEMDISSANENDRAYIYIYKDEAPDLSIDVAGNEPEEVRQYLRSTSLRNGTVNFADPEISWTLAFRDADTTSYYMVFYNPDNPENPYDDGRNTEIVYTARYEPLLPLLPVFFLLAFIVLLPLTIIRVYIITQKKKELRVLLSLDLENLSNEDKVRLGIPVSSNRQDMAD